MRSSWLSQSSLALLILSVGISAFAGSPASTMTNGKTEISVMAYNVANLFDTKHDINKDDWTYLPLAEKNKTVQAECSKITVWPWKMECLKLDWTDAVLKVKMEHVADSILSINGGRGPDVLMLEEVENIGVLDQLNDNYLQAAGYKTVILIEGNDDRGIDQAILSRLPLNGTAVNNWIPLGADPRARKTPSRTRGLLQANLTLPDGTLLTVFTVHFPSGGEAHVQRVQAIDFLNKKRAELPKDRLVVVGGDFNINSDEDAKNAVYEKNLEPWMISHRIGCAGCQGTEYYKTADEWSFLDALGFSKNLDATKAKTGWVVDTASIQIPTYGQYQVGIDGRPANFDPIKKTGCSDHFPIFAILRK